METIKCLSMHMFPLQNYISNISPYELVKQLKIFACFTHLNKIAYESK